ncbi:MAG: Maf family protein [Pseudonocardiaceae bacterium]
MSSRLLLASSSPQRRAILEGLGVAFEVAVPEIEELSDGEPGPLVLENALRKARSVAARAAGGRIVLGVDTVVSLDGRVFGKPRDAAEAEGYLRELSGRTHDVHSGLALVGPDGEHSHEALTRVRFRNLSQADLDWYVTGGEWRERAGGYAIQGRGAALVERIEGDYLNVVGLPAALLVRLLAEKFPGTYRFG